jgi:flagellar L-ring protein precursor FlgH
MMMRMSMPLMALAVCACASNEQPSGPFAEPVSGPVHTPIAVRTVAADSAPALASRGSLWDTSPTALLGMRRAKDVGDLLTIVVEIDDRASLQNSQSRNRQSNEDASLGAFFGLENLAGALLPEESSLNPAVEFERSSAQTGNGSVARAESIAFNLGARVVGVEPNGNLVIAGNQEMLVGGESRVLSITGVVRAQDITRTNTVSYEKIAEAQIAYLNGGEVTDSARRSRVGRVVDWVIPH